MKLNKFLAAAVAATVLPLSVAHAEGPATQPELPEFTGGVNPADAPVLEKPEFKGGVNGAEPAVLEKPEFKLPAGKSSDDTFGPRKGQAPAKAQNGQKVLPKTSAVK